MGTQGLGMGTQRLGTGTQGLGMGTQGLGMDMQGYTRTAGMDTDITMITKQYGAHCSKFLLLIALLWDIPCT